MLYSELTKLLTSSRKMIYKKAGLKEQGGKLGSKMCFSKEYGEMLQTLKTHGVICKAVSVSYGTIQEYPQGFIRQICSQFHHALTNMN